MRGKVLLLRRGTLLLILTALVAAGIFMAVGGPSFVSASAAKRQLPIYSVEREEKVCAISFDAAWGNEDTQALIDILGKYNVKATFFVVGDWVDKYPESVKALHDAGLSRAYLGVESGSDAVLKFIHKGVGAQQMLQAGQRLVEAGIDLWVTVILGITGEGGDWKEHILSTAKIINEMKPRHLSAMTFAPAKGTPLGDDVLAGRFKVYGPDHILEECRLLIEHLDVDPLHFTSNHASNYLPLKGGLPEDREKFLSLIDQALEGKIRLRKTLNRGI